MTTRVEGNQDHRRKRKWHNNSKKEKEILDAVNLPSKLKIVHVQFIQIFTFIITIIVSIIVVVCVDNGLNKRFWLDSLPSVSNYPIVPKISVPLRPKIIWVSWDVWYIIFCHICAPSRNHKFYSGSLSRWKFFPSRNHLHNNNNFPGYSLEKVKTLVLIE